MITLRPDQRETVDKAKGILRSLHLVYLAAQMRTGKSIMGLTIAYESGWKDVLVITKKKAIPSINSDIKACGYPMNVTVTTHESAKNFYNTYDGYIVDEANEAAGAYPIPRGKTKAIKAVIGSKPLILMSGTPSAEGWSQLFHQFWLSAFSPFKKYANFYKWAKDFVKQYEYDDKDAEGNPVKKFRVKQKYLGGMQVNDYSEGIEAKIKPVIAPYMVYLTQEEAGFNVQVEEEILKVAIDENIYKLMERIKRDQVYTLKSGDTIVADTPVRMQNIFHQLSSGTIKIDDKYIIIDRSKALFIRTYFAGKKIAIFYKFIAEGNLLREIFPNNTDNDALFNSRPDLTYICQIKTGRSGVNLSTADFLVMYNIDFSATSYWQGRERLGAKDRTKQNKMFWIFSERGFESKVYKAVVKKKSYTNSHFKKDLKEWQASPSSKQKS
jgi:hypothetical protein